MHLPITIAPDTTRVLWIWRLCCHWQVSNPSKAALTALFYACVHATYIMFTMSAQACEAWSTVKLSEATVQGYMLFG